MSWHYFAGGAVVSWQESSLDGAPDALIRKNHADGNLQEQLMRLYERMTTPRCQEILMMWPEGWTDSKPLAMDGFRKWLQEHSNFYRGHDDV